MIIKGDPEIRREFFNKSIFHANQYYYNYTLKYNQILKSRNKVLKELFEGLHKKTELLDVLDEQFTEISLQIYNERINYLIDYIPIFIETVKKLSDKDFLPYLIYKTEFNYKSKEAFLSKLKSKRQSEINQKRTLVGPHLDDYKIITNDKELKFFGSQGEIRLFTLAIKISHIIYIFEKTKSYPILLLDDISSELDEKRKLFLFNFLKTIDSQIFITTADLNSLPELEKVSFFEVVDGFFENKF
jgi:DNA replication and repair protein RecF